MKLSLRIPLLIGVLVITTSLGIGITSLQVSSAALESSILDGIEDKNEANAEYLAAMINGQLDVLWEVANSVDVRTMDEDIIRSALLPVVSHINAIEIAILHPNGVSRDVVAGTSFDISHRDYFKRAIAGEKCVELVISRLSGDLEVVFAVPVLRDDTPGAPVIGVLISRKDGGQTLSDIVVNLASRMPSAYSYLLNMEGTAIAHQNTEMVKNQFNPIKQVDENPALKSLAEMTEKALVEKYGITRYTFNGKNMIGCYDPVPGYPWLLFSTIEKSDVDNQLVHMRYIIIAIGVLFLAVALVVAFFIGRSIVKPFVKIAVIMNDVGKGDLTNRINLFSKDEIGDLSQNFNSTLENVKNLILNIRKEADTLNNIGADLAGNMNETAAAVNQITANIQSIKGRVLNQSASVSETHATMEQLVVNINKLDKLVENQSSHVSDASSAIEEMVANTNSVTGTLVNNVHNVKNLKEASEVGRSGLQEVAEDIQEISRESEGLMEINSVMENIASQTNLLSMNAAIEAAHAGEAGKGFAVVADEIRKLAESSGEQSKTIGVVLKKIKGSIDKIMKSTETVLTRFEAIDSSVKTVSEQEDNIRRAMEEQGIGSKQILDGVSQVNGITRQVQGGSHEMLEGAKEVITESTNLEKVTQEITSGMNEMASGADQINVAVNHVSEISGKNREGIETLLREVSRFKIE
ncbi:MAG: methyl-accepting chemotaxis protein [Treponema sp.]|nr:methyl-accepting chemotaxis protein [Treponema sp.]